jgi:hypothetical protein
MRWCCGTRLKTDQPQQLNDGHIHKKQKRNDTYHGTVVALCRVSAHRSLLWKVRMSQGIVWEGSTLPSSKSRYPSVRKGHFEYPWDICTEDAARGTQRPKFSSLEIAWYCCCKELDYALEHRRRVSASMFSSL